MAYLSVIKRYFKPAKIFLPAAAAAGEKYPVAANSSNGQAHGNSRESGYGSTFLHAETVEFDDPALANLLFGPHNAHLELLTAASGASIGSRGAVKTLSESPDLNVRQLLCNVVCAALRSVARRHFTQPAGRIPQLRHAAADLGLNLEKIFKDAVSSIRLQNGYGPQCGPAHLS